jgi:hypothetical protein
VSIPLFLVGVVHVLGGAVLSPSVGMEQQITIGWWEWVRLPGVSFQVIRAKADTGAAASSLHAEDIEFFKRGDVEFVRFRLSSNEDMVELRVVELRQVKSSNGETQLRPAVLIPVEVAGVTFAIDCTLTDRTPMAYPMLLGRTALAGRFLVDSGREKLHPRPRTTRRRK